jgi:hypothetical protein
MTYRDYIRTELLERAAERYPDNTRLQMLYQIGFLQAQLASAIRADNYNYLRFKQALERSDQMTRSL